MTQPTPQAPISEERLREIRAGLVASVETRADALIRTNRRIDLIGITQRCVDTIAAIDELLSRRSQGNDARERCWSAGCKKQAMPNALLCQKYGEALPPALRGAALSTPTASQDVQAQG